jgi:murein DD-endopeptidase MepM/ murein hydrolase activator NlpD
MGKAAAASFVLLAALCFSGSATGSGSPDVAALQVGLKSRGFYGGTVDGVLGAGTEQSLRRFQQRKGLVADGVPGPQTRRALGRYGRRAPLGRRPLAFGRRGWDVAALQFSLAWHGFPSGAMDGSFGSHTDVALRGFQRWAGIVPDGVAGPGTVRALRGPLPRSPLPMSRPLIGPVGDIFGPRGNRFHEGIDFPAPAGTPVGAARAGHVVFAGPSGSGWGTLVVIGHGNGVRTRYAHLSKVLVEVGESVSVGAVVGRVGSTGESTGPHLHFEVVVRGANVDPLSTF